MMYVVTVYLFCGDEITIKCRYLEATILMVEGHYGDALMGWNARRL